MILTRAEKETQLNMPFEEKIKRTKELILEWYLQYRGAVYVSFSGGKDSTVLLHLARQIKGCGDIPGVFSDTGLEYPEIRNFVKSVDNVIWVKPKLTFKEVLDKYGWPIITKEQSRAIYDIRTTKSQKLLDYRLNGQVSNGAKLFHAGVLSKRWRPLINASFKISNKCCAKTKKEPLHTFNKKTGWKPILGTMAEESSRRLHQYMGSNCNAFNEKNPVSRPMMFWNEQDVLRYIVENDLQIASVYGSIEQTADGRYYTTGCRRTGCMFCMYGVHLEGHPNRFERMKETHPVQYDYIMNKLGGKNVLNAYLACVSTPNK